MEDVDMKWFSIEGIKTEIGRIRWPKGKEFQESITDVLSFTIALCFFFVVCESVVATILRAIGA